MQATKSKDCFQKKFRKNRWVKKTKLTKLKKDENNMDGLAEKNERVEDEIDNRSVLDWDLVLW